MPTVEGFTITRETVETFVTTEADWPFHCPDISPLYDIVAVQLVNREIAGNFEAEYPPVEVGTRIAVNVQVLGMFDLDGADVDPTAAREQTLTNLKHIRNDVTRPVQTGDGVATLELFGVGGVSEGTADIQFVGPLRPVIVNPHSCIVTFDMYFPRGVIGYSS